MKLIDDKRIGFLERFIQEEQTEKKKNEITNLYAQYKVFTNNQAMNNLIIPGLEKYITTEIARRRKFEI